MRCRNVHRVLFSIVAAGAILAPVLIAILPQSADGTASLMTKLPAFGKFRCALCHVSATPANSSHELNPFGRDFRENNYIWDETLAQMNSDGDRCSNGFELGDSDGDGILDSSESTEEYSNPGDPSDCSIAITAGTWGIIKKIFSGEGE